MGIVALALTFTMSNAVQADDFPGEYHIVAAGETQAKGWMPTLNWARALKSMSEHCARRWCKRSLPHV
jgi:hypothetical protein